MVRCIEVSSLHTAMFFRLIKRGGDVYIWAKFMKIPAAWNVLGIRQQVIYLACGQHETYLACGQHETHLACGQHETYLACVTDDWTQVGTRHCLGPLRVRHTKGDPNRPYLRSTTASPPDAARSCLTLPSLVVYFGTK